jgi:hypothetical protein
MHLKCRVDIAGGLKVPRIATAALLSILIATFNSRSEAAFYSLETDQLMLVYEGQALAYLAPHVARCFENSLHFHRQLFDYTPSEPINLLMHDFSDFHQAGVTTTPWNTISLGIAPPSYAFETAPANEQINATLHHEVAHIAASDKAAAPDGFFRSVFFGKVRETADHPVSILYSYLTTPRRSTPRWYQEGIAVFMETWMTGGLGRALSSYDEMVFRTAVRDSARLYDRVGLESEGTEVDFQVGANSYLYGTRFMSYLALHYGPESLLRWVSRSAGSKAYFATQFREIYGTSLDNEWSRWIEWESQFQQENLDAIRLNPTTSFRTVSPTALGSVSRAAFDTLNRTLYVAVNYPGQVAFIAAINLDDGTIKRICDVKGPALYYVSSLAYDPTSETLFYTTDNSHWRDLKTVEVHTGRSRTLIKDARVGDLAFNEADKTLWGVRHFNGIATLVRIPPPYDKWHQVVSLPYGRNIYGLDISPDGAQLSAGLSHVSGRQTLIVMDILTRSVGDTSHQVLFDFENSIPANFVWSRDGNCLLGTSYYTGVSNVFRYDFSRNVMEAISNCETGFFNVVPISDDSLIVFRYTSKGFVPVIIACRSVERISAISLLGQEVVQRHPIVTEWLADSPGSISLDSATSYNGIYNGLKKIRLAWAYPVVEGYRSWPAYGVHLEFRDPINLHRLRATGSYTPNDDLPANERWHFELGYAKLHWEARFRHHDADFYDPYSREFLRNDSKIMTGRVDMTGYWGLERLPEFQNITTSFDQFLSLDATIGHSNQRASLGAVDFEKGHRWLLSSNSKYVNRRLFTRIYTTLDYGIALPWHHSSVWLRSAVGYSPNERNEPLANFYFGGFGNNWVDHRTIQRYRTYSSFPGLELNEVGGVNFSRVLIEWALPSIRFRRLGIPMLHANWVRTTLFSSALTTNLDAPADRISYWNAGSQFDIRLILMSRLRMTLSGGAAIAISKGRRASGEFMLSLKVL